jgi:hypothetical protein
MEESMHMPPAGESRAITDELQNGPEEQQQVLYWLSRELDDYFALRRFRDSE